jgi:hypothetical protein
MNKRPKDLYVKFVSASAPLTHAWTPEKNRLILIILPGESFTYIYAIWLTDFQACFQSDTIVVYCRRRHIVYTGYTKKFIDLWTDQKRKSSSSYERIKKARER